MWTYPVISDLGGMDEKKTKSSLKGQGIGKPGWDVMVMD